LAGSDDNAGPRDEHGKLIKFPRSAWVSEDGVEPLTARTAEESTTATVERADGELEAFEPDDFWASGETQQFVGAPSSSRAVASPGMDGAKGNEDGPAISLPKEPRPRSGHRWRQLSLPLPTKLVAAAIVLCALAGSGIASVFLTAGRSEHSPSASIGRNHAATDAPVRRPWAVRNVRNQAVTHRPRRAHRHKPTPRVRKRTVVAASAPSTSTPAASTPTQPVYQPPPASTVSTGHHRSSGGHRAGPTGTVSLIGAGTSPSG
jgi:hypothetical protein